MTRYIYVGTAPLLFMHVGNEMVESQELLTINLKHAVLCNYDGVSPLFNHFNIFNFHLITVMINPFHCETCGDQHSIYEINSDKTVNKYNVNILMSYII